MSPVQSSPVHLSPVISYTPNFFMLKSKQHELHVATEPKVQFDILWHVDNCYIAVLSLSHGGHQLLVLISCLIW